MIKIDRGYYYQSRLECPHCKKTSMYVVGIPVEAQKQVDDFYDQHPDMDAHEMMTGEPALFAESKTSCPECGKEFDGSFPIRLPCLINQRKEDLRPDWAKELESS